MGAVVDYPHYHSTPIHRIRRIRCPGLTLMKMTIRTGTNVRDQHHLSPPHRIPQPGRVTLARQRQVTHQQ